MNQTRESLLADYTAATAASLEGLSIDALVPQVRDAAYGIVAAPVTFVPTQLRDGVVTIHPDYEGIDGPALLPLLPGDSHTFTLGPSALKPSPRRLAHMAEETGLTGEGDRVSLLDAFDRNTGNGVTSADIPKGFAAATLAKHTALRVGGSGRTLTFHTRPLIVVKPEVANLPPEVQGSLLVHEAVHYEDRERVPALGRVEQLDPVDGAIATATLELRGYYLGTVAAGSVQHPILDRQAEVEAVRAANADPENPFRPTRAIMKYLLTEGIVAL